MKDSSALALRGNRNAAYPKKRPSPTVRDGAVAKRKSAITTTTTTSSPITAASVVAGLKQKLAEEEAKRRFLAMQHHKLLEVEYRNEILKYMHDMESQTMSSAASMDQQPEIRWEMRPCLVDFLVECHMSLRLRPETLYLTLNIVDRYVSRRVVYVKHYQLVGCTALWIAAKFEDAKDRTPSVHDLVELCQHAYEPPAFLQMELHVLNTIGWLVGHPTAESWLRFACANGGVEDATTQHIARFLMEISLFHRDYINFGASAIASGALCLARFIMGKTRRPADESRAGLDIVDMLDEYLTAHAHELSETLVKKYSFPYYSKASNVVLSFYLKGNRFVHSYLPELPPITPMSASSFSTPRTPMSAASSRSSMTDSDDMPVTPVTPSYSSDPFTTAVPFGVLKSKENLPLGAAKVARGEDESTGARLAMLGLASSPIAQ